MSFDRTIKTKKKAKDPRSIIFANILIKLLWERDSKIYVNDLKEEYNLSDRTIRGYFKDLQEIIFTVSRRLKNNLNLLKARDDIRGNYWYLAEGSITTPSIYFDQKENIKIRNKALDYINKILVLYLADRFFERFKAENLRKEADNIYQDLIDSLRYKCDIQDFLNNLNKIFYFLPFAPKEYDPKILQCIIDGIVNKKVLKIEYFGLDYTSPNLVSIKPLSIVYFDGLLYLLGMGAERKYKAIRTFAIDRITKIGYTGRIFQFKYDSFNPEDHINKYIGIIKRGHKKRFELVFKNDMALKRLIRERKWFENQIFEELEDGRLKMRFTTYPTEEVKKWILSFGRDVKVLKPGGFLRESL